MRTIISTAIVFFSTIFIAGAQNSFLSLSGQVTDIATGAPIQNHIVNAEVMGGGMVQYYDYYTNAQGYYGDTIPTFFGVGTINVSTVDCNGDIQSYSGTFSPNNVYFVFDFSICADSSGSGCQAKFAYFVMENGLVAFYDQSTGSPATGYPDHWQWDFGDGQTSNEQNPVHAYNGFGPYNVCLTVWDDEGFCLDTYCELVYLNGTGGDCLNWFTYETFNYVDYAFMGQSVPSPADYYYWDFGDGSYGTGQDVLHSYGPNTGDYVTVVLTTFSYDPATGDSCVAVSIQEIWLNGSGNDCDNWFWYEQTNTSEINFHGESFPLPAMLYHWDFGDGQTASGQEVSHTYEPNTGNVFLVTLTTYSWIPGTADTCVAYSMQEVWITTPPGDCQNFFWYETPSPFIYTFHGDSFPFPADQYMWQFDNGMVLFGQDVTYTFDPSWGNEHIVCLTTYTYNPNSDSCSYTSCQVINVGGQTGIELFGTIYTSDSLLADYALVGLFGMNPNGSFTYDFATTEMGKYYFNNVQPGDYYIFASLTPQSQFFYDYFTTYYGDAITWSGATLITLGEAQNPYDIHLVPVEGVVAGSGVINGSVTIVEGKGDPGTNIIIMLMDESENMLAFTESNDEGLFSFENLAFGTYKLKVEIPGKPSAIATVVLEENNPEGEVSFIVKDAEVTLTAREIPTFATYVGEIFPNPVACEANLEISLIRPSNLMVKILNQLGQEVLSSKVSLTEGNQMISIEASNLKSGFYTLQITNGEGGMLVKKFIK